MATVVIFGLVLSSLLTLVFIPVVYTIFDNRHMNYLGKKEKKALKKIERSKKKKEKHEKIKTRK